MNSNRNHSDKVIQLSGIVVDRLLATQRGEKVLIVTDVSGTAENGDIVAAIAERSRQIGAETLVVEMNDNAAKGIEYLPDAIQHMMPQQDIIISLTRTTSAPLPHHKVPIDLVRQGKLRGVFMVKRSRADLMHDSVLEADYELMSEVAEYWQAKFHNGERVHVTTPAGTDFTASLKGQPSFRSNFAHKKGQMSPVNWGEVYQGPVVGTTNGRAVIDGPVLGFDWPKTPVIIDIADGLVQKVSGDPEVSAAITRLIEENVNGDNIAEIAMGINPAAHDHSCNIYKKGLGRLHIAIGNGLVYAQDVDSPIHIDFIMHEPTVTVDGQVIVRDGVIARD